jgi:multidrug efflux pump subunit AcrA (membrane-fusion protein)
VVTVKSAQPGEIVSPQFLGGGGIAKIVDMDSLEVDVDVGENFINRVHSKQPAVIMLNAYPGWQIPAQVIAVIPTADRSKATVKVRIGFKQKDARIVPEMGVRVSFLDESPQPPPPASSFLPKRFKSAATQASCSLSAGIWPNAARFGSAPAPPTARRSWRDFSPAPFWRLAISRS